MPQSLFLCLIQFVVMALVIIGGQKESTRAAGRVVHSLAGCGPHYVHDGLDERTRREILPRPSLHVRRVFLQQAFVGVALHIDFQSHPLLFANQIGDKALQLGRVLHLVLCLSENYAEHTRLLPKLRQDVAVVTFQEHRRRDVLDPLNPNPLECVDGRLYGDFVCSSAIFRKRRNVNCST